MILNWLKLYIFILKTKSWTLIEVEIVVRLDKKKATKSRKLSKWIDTVNLS